MSNEPAYETKQTTHPKNAEGQAYIRAPGPEWTQVDQTDNGDHFLVTWRKETGPQVLVEG